MTTTHPTPTDPIEGPRPRPSWFTRYRDETELDYYGRRVFRFHRCFPWRHFECVEVLLAVSVAVAVLALSDPPLRFEVDHIELYLRNDDAFRLGPQLHRNTDWPPWAHAAEVVDGEPEGDADLTVVLVGAG